LIDAEENNLGDNLLVDPDDIVSVDSQDLEDLLDCVDEDQEV
jgi:hypothetical protein